MSVTSTFAKFAKTSSVRTGLQEAKTAVVYTRVSSKEQADTNLSLDFQKKAIEEYAGRNAFTTVAYFGGTYESAKTDGRKEFGRMLDFIRKNKGKVSHILVYTLDRFSRTGGGAIKLAEELREKYGVTVFAVTQPADTSNPSGVLQQSVHFIFSQYDNQLRKQRAVAGMKEKFQKGIWCVKPPFGYDIIRRNGERKIVVNEIGKKLKKAFIWKSQGLKNEEIIVKLNALGVSMYKQKLSQTFDNPFYCGMLSHKMLDGKVVEGTHEKLVSVELFLSLHEAKQKRGGKLGVSHQKENDAIPLKTFLYCEECNQPLTGYIVRSKGIYYYKCPTKGCKCNKNADALNKAFIKYLQPYQMDERFSGLLLKVASKIFDKQQEASGEEGKIIAANLKGVKDRMEKLEERYFTTSEMSRETYERLLRKFGDEKRELEAQLQNTAVNSSNLKNQLEEAVTISSKLAPTWISSDVKGKEIIQRMVFPKGIAYNRQKETLLTTEVNSVFQLMADVAKLSADGKNDKGTQLSALSSLVGTTRFELATPCTPCNIF